MAGGGIGLHNDGAVIPDRPPHDRTTKNLPWHAEHLESPRNNISAIH